MENTNTKNTLNAAEALKPAAPAAAKKDTTDALKTEERKEENMNAKKTAEALKPAAKKTEPAKKPVKPAAAKPEEKTVKTAEEIKSLFTDAKTASRREDREKAMEKATAEAEAFNAFSLKNAVKRASFLSAAEAFRPNPPKAEAARDGHTDYIRRAEPVTYVVIDLENGEAKTRRLNLSIFAREAFKAGKFSAEVTATVHTALLKIEALQKSMIEDTNISGAKTAAEAVTSVVKACGLNAFTQTEKGYDFYVDRSFLYKAAAASLKYHKGVYTSAAAAIAEAAGVALNATTDKRTKAAEALKKAEENGVKAVFNIVSEAAAAAVIGQWKAHLKTEEEVKTAAAAAKKTEPAKKPVKPAAAAKKTA